MFFSLMMTLFGGFIFLNSFFEQMFLLMVILLISIFNFCYIVEYNMFTGGFNYDLLSITLILLSVWIIFLMWVNDLKEKFLYSNILSYMLLYCLVLCFMTSDMVEMYIFFEFSLVPLVLLIMLGGNSPERLISSMYMFLYTLMGSLPFMLTMFYMVYYNMDLNLYKSIYMYNKDFTLVNTMMLLMFLIKMPMYGVHLWLPKAHTEAPVTGSMILAGLMLKLGGYGLYRLLYFYNLNDLWMMKLFVVSISIMGGLFVGVMCLRQVDIKLLIAYSSVCHMSLVLGGIFSFTVMGAYGVLMLMLAHGLCSSGLFFSANVIYTRVKTRSLILLKGISFVFTNLIVFLFILLVFNLGAPPSMNFMSELLLVYSIVNMSMFLMFVVIFISLVSGAYSLYLYMQISHGMFWGMIDMRNEDLKEIFIIFCHIWPLLLYVLNMNLFMEWL